jgi:Na+/melibiose symporter-like transporter
MVKDLRKYAQSTNFRLILGGLILVTVVAFILIALFYGINSALFGLICVFAALIPISIVLFLFFLLNRYISNERKKQE